MGSLLLDDHGRDPHIAALPKEGAALYTQIYSYIVRGQFEQALDRFLDDIDVAPILDFDEGKMNALGTYFLQNAERLTAAQRKKIEWATGLL